jgi:hypothetical protein
MKPSRLLVLLLSLGILSGCKHDVGRKTKLVYFGLDDRSENSEDAIRLAQLWGTNPPCPNWRATITREKADYQVLFGIADVTLVDRKGQVLYSGGPGVLSMPHGNPDGSGVNLCKLTEE